MNIKHLSRHQKNNLIIIGLLAIVAVMAIGYAAFSSQLRIEGASNISSKFAVLITGIELQDVVGGARDTGETTYTDTTATFYVDLTSPGDSITYKITVYNQGTLDATLSSIDIQKGNNDAIVFETSGIEEGDNLLKEQTDELFVKVTYNSSVTSQPENTNSEITVTLNYEQATGATVPEEPEGEGINGVASEVLPTLVVSDGDGLYVDTYEDGRYVYKGTNPSNYITFNDETWRIVSINTETNQIKIIRNAVLEDRQFDAAGSRLQTGYCNVSSSYGCNIWGSSSTMYNANGSKITTLYRDFENQTEYVLPTLVADLNTYLNETYYNSTLNTTARNQIAEGWFNVGPVESHIKYNISQNVEQSKAAGWEGKIGLIDATEYVKASINSNCDSVYDFTSDNSLCNTRDSAQNYLHISDVFWTLSPYSTSDASFLFVVASSGMLAKSDAYFSYGVRPVLYLKPDIQITGGQETEESPYTLS